ncbi:MAG: glycosyltransferase family 4 protein [Gemmatimonadota bacterium]
MRILLLAPHEFYIDRGTPMDTDLLLRALGAGDHQIDLVVYGGGQHRDYPGVTIHRAKTPRWLTGIRPGFSYKKVLADFWLFAAARRLVRRNSYDIVHAGEEAVFMALWFRFRHGIPYIYDMDSAIAHQLVEASPWLKPLRKVFDWIVGLALRRAIAVAPVCQALAELAESNGAKQVVILHDISQLQNPGRAPTGELRQSRGIQGPLVMYVGNFERYQGIALLLSAFSRAVANGSDAALVLAGGIPSHIAKYREAAEDLGIGDRTHFVGHWPADRLDEILAEADVLVSPRTSGINTPMKVFPFMHSGKALLATDIRTHNQILTPDIARLAPPEPEAFAGALLELCNDPALRERIGQAGRAFVEQNHTFEAHVRRVEALYRFIAERVGQSPLHSTGGPIT